MAQLIDLALVAGGLLTLIVMALVIAFAFFFARGMARTHRRRGGDWWLSLPRRRHHGRHRPTRRAPHSPQDGRPLPTQGRAYPAAS